MTKMKNFLSMAMILVFMIAFAAPVGATVEGTKGTPIIDETFDYEDGTLVTSLDDWSAIQKDLKTALTGMDNKFTIKDGKLVIAAGESTDTSDYGVSFTIGDTTNYQWGFAPWRNSNNASDPLRKKADEYVFEFDAEIGAGAKLYFNNAGTSYFYMWNLGNDNGKLSFVESAAAGSGYANCVFLPDGEHHFKIVLRPVCYKTVDGQSVALTEDEVVEKSTDVITEVRVMTDIYIDDVCYVINELAKSHTTKPHNQGLLSMSVVHGAKTSTQSTFDNLKFYYLDDEKRSDVSTRFLAVNNDSAAYTYLTLFDHTKPAERLNVTGSKLVAEIRYDGTQAANEGVTVFLAQFGADGKLKSVNMADATVTAGSTDKVTVTLESTEDAPLFDADNIAEDDYLQAFVWTADGMVPLCAERTAGTIAE